MLYLKSSEEKKLTFEVDIHGVETGNLKGYVRFELYGAEYGFPAEIERNRITATIPPLTEIVKKDIEDGTVINARLEMFTDKHYFSPWSGEVKVGAPMDIRAKLKEDKTPGIKTKLVTSELEESKSAKKENIKEEKALESKDLKSMIREVLTEMVPTKKKKVSESSQHKKEEITKEYLRNITEDGILKYIEKAGAKKKEIQTIILNQARAAAGSTDNFKVLKEVVKIMKKKRG
jgi:hypothetical protein